MRERNRIHTCPDGLGPSPDNRALFPSARYALSPFKNRRLTAHLYLSGVSVTFIPSWDDRPMILDVSGPQRCLGLLLDFSQGTRFNVGTMTQRVFQLLLSACLSHAKREKR